MSQASIIPTYPSADAFRAVLMIIAKIRVPLPRPAGRRRRVDGLTDGLLADLGLRPVGGPTDSRRLKVERHRHRTERLCEFDYAYYAAKGRR